MMILIEYLQISADQAKSNGLSPQPKTSDHNINLAMMIDPTPYPRWVRACYRRRQQPRSLHVRFVWWQVYWENTHICMH